MCQTLVRCSSCPLQVRLTDEHASDTGEDEYLCQRQAVLLMLQHDLNKEISIYHNCQMVTHCHEKICEYQLFFRGSNICWTYAE